MQNIWLQLQKYHGRRHTTIKTSTAVERPELLVVIHFTPMLHTTNHAQQ
jgi:hypothetical protein